LSRPGKNAHKAAFDEAEHGVVLAEDYAHLLLGAS